MFGALNLRLTDDVVDRLGPFGADRRGIESDHVPSASADGWQKLEDLGSEYDGPVPFVVGVEQSFHQVPSVPRIIQPVGT